jgi:NitT/TauT family transport system substrate-binding protein
MKMKKLKALLLLAFCMVMIAGCAKNKNNTSTQPQATKGAAATQAPTTAAAASTVTPAAGDAQTTAAKIDMKIAALKGPTAIGMVKMMDDAKNNKTANNYTFSVAGAADEISTGLVKGDFDIAAVPCNLAAVLYNKTQGQIKVAGINTLGVLYIVETGNTIQSVKDLKGKTIYSTGFGTTPQYTLNYILKANGLDPEKDVKVEYKTEATEVAALLTKSTSDTIAMLPQPYVTTVMMSNSKLRIALDVSKEWSAANKDGNTVVTGVVVVRKDFLDKNPDAVAKFMEEYKASADYVNSNVDAAAALVESCGIFKAAVAKTAIPLCNITFINGDEMKTKVNGYLQTLFDENPKAIGGKMPSDDFYYLP